MSRPKLENLPRPGLSPQQRSWLGQLDNLLGGAAAKTAEAEPAGGRDHLSIRPRPAPDAAPGGTTKSLLGLPDIPDPTITCTVKIINKSAQTLVLVPGSIKLENPNGSEFDTPPPSQIGPADDSGDIVISNNFPYTTGVGGELWYQVAGDAENTRFFVKWERGRVPRRKAIFRVLPNQQRFTANGGFNGDTFTYTFASKSGGGTQPKPPDSTDTKASCLITVNNQTQLPLTLADQDHEFGDFQTQPPASIPPGGSAAFASVETPRGKDHRCKGFVSWEVGSPMAAVWRIEWDNPVGERNTARSTAEPQSAGFRTVNQAGQGDENAPFIFTLSDGPAGSGPGPGPGPNPQAEDDDKNAMAPPGSRQPTLRRGDKSADGWVEFLQVQLNHHLGAGLEVDGNFGQKTEQAVRTFQTKNKLQVDGVVGNQTWAALREDTPEKPSSDGRKPHTFEEKGPEARFDNENVDGVYLRTKDTLLLFVASVGEEPIDKFHIHLRVTPPDGPTVAKKFVIGPPGPNQGVADQPGGGAQHKVEIRDFRKIFLPKGSTVSISDCKFEAFFDPELGSDVFRGKIQEKP